jgi:hypothetical protein
MNSYGNYTLITGVRGQGWVVRGTSVVTSCYWYRPSPPITVGLSPIGMSFVMGPLGLKRTEMIPWVMWVGEERSS